MIVLAKGLTLYTAAVWSLAGLGVLIAGWALFLDRSRGRRRCPKCWYDMAGVDGLQCPECGTSTGSERRLHSTRRRRGWAMLAVVLCLAPVADPIWRGVQQELYWRWMPKSLLIRALPWACERPKYWSEFEARVVEPILRNEEFPMTLSTSYRARSLSQAQLDLLADEICIAIGSRKLSFRQSDLLKIVDQLGLSSARLESVVTDAIGSPDWSMVRYAIKIAREREYLTEAVLLAVIAVTNRQSTAWYSGIDEEEALIEAASYLGYAGAEGGHLGVVPALIKLNELPHGPKVGYALHHAVLRAFADIGPAASMASELLRVPEDDEPSYGGDAPALFAYWMVSGKYGGRCETLMQMAARPQWAYRSFAARELGVGVPCPDVTSLLAKLMHDDMHWVQNDAAMSLIKLRYSGVDIDKFHLIEAGRLLKINAARSFDALSIIFRFVKEQGLDPGPLEVRLPWFRSPTSRVASGNVDSLERRMREYRDSHPKSEAFKPW